MSKTSFKELNVWQDAKQVAVDLYKLTNEGYFNKDYGLREQMRRAAISIVSNIAEGNDRETDREFIRYLYISKGSCAELIAQLNIAHDIGYINEETMSDLEKRLIKISNMIGALIRKISLREESKQ